MPCYVYGMQFPSASADSDGQEDVHDEVEDLPDSPIGPRPDACGYEEVEVLTLALLSAVVCLNCAVPFLTFHARRETPVAVPWQTSSGEVNRMYNHRGCHMMPYWGEG